MRLRIVLALEFLLWFGGVSWGESGLESGFKTPPADSKPHIWWHWMNGNITREGIKADLESMAEVGIGGAQIFNVGAESGPVAMPEGPVDYMSDQWLELVKYAAEQADRLGLELCLHNCAGWTCSGGPWITPDISMQMLTWSEASVNHSGPVEIKLARPNVRENYYRDIAVIAFPRPQADSFRVDNWRSKAGFEDRQYKLLPDVKDVPAGAVIARDRIVDISDKMDSEGVLKWQVPAGRWTILRIGHTSTGKTNRPAPKPGRGLECDKLSREALDIHWDNGIQPVLDKLGSLAGPVLNNILIDSYEAGINNWTPKMFEEFEGHTGYSLRDMLPALTGRVVESSAVTERFLWDYRRTISDMITENYFDYFIEKCHNAGLLCSIEPYDGPFESTQVGNNADILMSEFWVKHPINHSLKLVSSIAHTNGQKYVGAESFTSNPHGGKWQNYPGSLKMLGEKVWCQGVNRYIFHSFAHQPWLDKYPGMTMGQWGSHFNRCNTWWNQSKSWMQYIARSQFLLQHGNFIADVLCYIGESVPGRLGNVGTAGGLNFDISGVSNKELRAAGYDYDICGADVLYEAAVKDGKLILPDGMQYRVLVLPDSVYVRPKVAEALQKLAEAGATIIAPEFKASPGLVNYPDCDQEVKQAAGKLLSMSAVGRVIWGRKLLDVLADMNVSPDCTVVGSERYPVEYIHRTSSDADIYFVSHQDDKNFCSLDMFFRVSGRVPELWDPVSGEIKNAGLWCAVKNGTKVSLNLGPAESVFVVFRKPVENSVTAVSLKCDCNVIDSSAYWAPEVASEGSVVKCTAWNNGEYCFVFSDGTQKAVEISSIPESVVVDKPWVVKFTPGWGAPDEIELTGLVSWTDHEDFGVKYYSGTGSYNTVLNLSENFINEAERIELDLGRVCYLAEVIINGNNLGILWCEPYKINVTDVVRSGSNNIEIRVTNLWGNRLIGDEQYPDDYGWSGDLLEQWPRWIIDDKPRPVSERLTFKTWNHWQKDDPLQPSGLIGPVYLRAGKQFKVEIN